MVAPFLLAVFEAGSLVIHAAALGAQRAALIFAQGDHGQLAVTRLRASQVLYAGLASGIAAGRTGAPEAA
jgi:hypothetical protein